MKWFLISLAIGLAASDKLDRTYLPPPGAQFSGGLLGNHDAPLEPPHRTPSGPGPIIGGQGSQPNFGIKGEPVQFGDKIPKVPVTTTSYAFSQTTTYPPGEGFETTVLPINPVTGLPIGFEQGNLPYGPSQGQVPNFGTNIQPGFVPQGPTSAPVNFDSPRDQFANQPLGQYTGQNVITPGGAPQIPGSVYPDQNQGQIQYPSGQADTEQQGFLPTGAPANQRFDQYPGQNIVNPGGVVQIPDGNQGLRQYPGGQTATRQQGLVPSTGSPINIQPGGNQQGVNYDGSQGTYTGQPINVPNLSGTQPTQTSYENQQPINVGGIPSQYPNGNQNNRLSVPTGSENVHQPGSTPSTIPSLYNNRVSSTTPYPGVPSPTSAYSSVGPVYRPERPQAAADRNAVILNYENVRTPNGYSYSFDTSNGIHADESGIVDNGTKAQGSYSYIGDDGKVYSVIYTADENGFQPRGDHLPTPPPIPEAIQRVIEQAARDKAAGIVHDGSYDEAKYGDKQYQETANRRRPQNQDTTVFGNKQFNGAQDDLIRPVAGIKDGNYNEGIAQNLINNNLPVTGTRKSSSNQLPTRRPSNEATGGNNVQKVSAGNRRISEDELTPIGDYDENGLPIQDETNQLDRYGTKKQGSSDGRPMPNGADLPFIGTEDSNQNDATGSKNPGSFGRRPVSGGVKDKMETKYPGSNVDVGAADYSETERDQFDNNNGQDIDSVSPNISNGTGEKINIIFDSATGSPVIGNRKTILRQRVKEDRRPDSTGNGYTQTKNDSPQGDSFTQKSTVTPFFSDYLKNAIANQQDTKQDNTGYQYKKPNTKFQQPEIDTFPTRFSPQEAPSTQPDQRRSEYVEGTTRKPFMTPNVYNQNNKNNQATPNKYNQNERNSPSTTRRPFTTIGVTSPTDNSYTEYDDDDNYATNQDIVDDKIESTKKPADNRVTSRPYPTTYTSSRPQNVPGSQRTRVNQKGTVTPGRRTENSGTVSPGYTYGPTTQMPSHNSRFGSTEIPRRMKPQQRRPSTSVPDSTTAVGKPVTTQSPAGTEQSNYKYQTTRPVSRYTDTNVGSGYPTTGSYPGLGSMTTTPKVSTPQDFYSSTYGPQGYYSTTSVPPTSGYIQGSGSQTPSGTPESLQPSQDHSFHNGYHYEPPKSGSFIPDNTGFFTPTGNSGVLPTSPTETYQTTYQQGPAGFPSTTLGPISPEIQGTFIPSQPGTFAPETSPTGYYQGSYQNGPSTPDYTTTIRSSIPESKPVFSYPGSAGVQESTGYEYGPSRPTYSTTDSPLTIGTTPGSFIPSGTTSPFQDYSTNYRPGLQTTKDTFVGGPVDGFGRPITTEQGGSHPGFGHPTLVTTGPGIIKGPNFGGTDQFTTSPGGFDQTRVIGEDFSGPKQPQRYDPITGYHY